MEAIRLPNGNLLAPYRAETGPAIGDGMIEIGPNHPDYESWSRHVAEPEPAAAPASGLETVAEARGRLGKGADFEEDKHPRDNKGEFAPKGEGAGGGGKGDEPDKKAAVAPAKKYDVPDDAWYISDQSPKLSHAETQKWADELSSRGWDAEAILNKPSVSYPQFDSYNYSPDLWTNGPGEYVAYRSGDVTEQPNGIYFGPSPDELKAYSGLHDGADIKKYKVTIKNPVVFQDKNEAMLALIPEVREKYQKQIDKYERSGDRADKPRPQKDLLNKSKDAKKTNRDIDAKLKKAMQKMGHDGMVLLNPEPPCTRELMIVDPKNVRAHE
jgi:hypothetical protein